MNRFPNNMIFVLEGARCGRRYQGGSQVHVCFKDPFVQGAMLAQRDVAQWIKVV